ncbi:uncharacterized protein LOC100907242 [Galendromus occidentalis]|uniref:Uncharacterized protein LOC100907242 n=1 Tax=Galendromus occidentalis TaxID=34638 RepID=A0AAJ6QTE8_9ACAR|nr:uncharacterized protein LOC100907242 [Galendromus occidentalis]
MRSLSIVALCLIVAQAYAIDFEEISQCVRERIGRQIDNLGDEVDGRLKKLAEDGNETAKRIRTEFKQKVKEFRRSASAPIDEARQQFDDCVEQADGFFKKAGCAIDAGKTLVDVVIPAAKQSAKEFTETIKEIAAEFGKEQRSGLDDMADLGRDFAKQALTSVKECVGL